MNPSKYMERHRLKEFNTMKTEEMEMLLEKHARETLRFFRSRCEEAVFYRGKRVLPTSWIYKTRAEVRFQGVGEYVLYVNGKEKCDIFSNEALQYLAESSIEDTITNNPEFLNLSE